MTQALAIGVDAGGSKTRAYASPAQTAPVEGGAANVTSLGITAATDAIVAVVRAAAAPHGGSPAAIVVAAAGAGRADVAERLAEGLRTAFPSARHVRVEDDTRAALRAGVPSGPGAVLIAGTGSVAYAEDGERQVRIGGLGPLLGDEGSGYAIGLAAVKLLARTYDGRAVRDETTDLAARAFAAPDRDALLRAVYEARPPPAAFAALAPAIVAFAGKGNRAATKIVQGAAQDLGDLIKRAVVSCGLLDRTPQIVFAGGLLRENSLLAFLLETRLGGDLPGGQIVRVRDEPALAALRFAHVLLAG